jgi:hypothetical protein
MTISEDFNVWYNTEHAGVINKNKHWSTFQINRFVKNTHRFLKLYGMCFLSGAYVFEDPESLLFNLLTYGKFEKAESGVTTRGNQNPTTEFSLNDIDNLASAHVSGTHNVFIKHNKSYKTPHHKYSERTAKFERLFKKQFRQEPFEYLCDLCVESPDIKNKEEKRVILYYPFLTKDTHKPMLYIKYESYPMNAREHAFEFLGNAAQSRANEYPKRRENGKSYKNELKERDTEFYKQNFSEDLLSLKKYNETYREGDEFFVGSNLLKYMLMTFLSNNDTPVCDVVVSKRPITAKKSSFEKSSSSSEKSSSKASSSKASSSKASSSKASTSASKDMLNIDLDALSSELENISLSPTKKKKSLLSRMNPFKTKKGGRKSHRRKTRKNRKYY